MDAETRVEGKSVYERMETREIERERNVCGTQAVAGIGSGNGDEMGGELGIDEAAKNGARGESAVSDEKGVRWERQAERPSRVDISSKGPSRMKTMVPHVHIYRLPLRRR